MEYDPKIHLLYKCPYCNTYLIAPISYAYYISRNDTVVNCNECNNIIWIKDNLVNGSRYKRDREEEKKEVFIKTDLLPSLIIGIGIAVLFPIICWIGMTTNFFD